MQKITPNLWFDKEAKEAANFYCCVFNKDSRIKDTTVLHNTPSGTVDIITIDLLGHEFVLLNAGPLFKFTPAISFLVACKTKEEVDEIWAKLADGGSALMEIGEYPFSERYGWIQDKYGLSWQVMYMGDRSVSQRIVPTLMFIGDNCGKAEEAINLYTSIFHDSKIGNIMRYGKDALPDKEGTVVHAGFTLESQEFAAMDSAHEHHFGFNEAISLIINCQDQAEVDYYWEKLSADPNSEQCGWLKDKYGISWQVNPIAVNEMLKDQDQEKVDGVTQALLTMKKLDIAKLKMAYEGR